MENIDISNLSYEELCILGNLIDKRKKKFVSLNDLYIINDVMGTPHLCYCSEPVIAYGYNFLYEDIFNKEYVTCVSLSYACLHLFKTYLKKYNIPFEDRYYLIQDLKELWKPIKDKLLIELLDAEQAKLDEKKRKLELPQNNK